MPRAHRAKPAPWLQSVSLFRHPSAPNLPHVRKIDVNLARFLSPLSLLLTWFALQSVALAQVGVPWTSGGQITTGGGYDLSTGMISREVVDFEVPGSVGTHPLRCARTLSTRAESLDSNDDLVAPVSYWHFEHFYIAWGATVTSVGYPSGRSVKFNSNGVADGVGDRLEYEKGIAARLRLTDGSVVEFSPAPGTKSSPTLYGSRILDP